MTVEGEDRGVLFEELLDASYDCVDRVVLRAYLQIGQAPAGFRTFWRRWKGSDDGLDNTHLMRVAGRFSRRVRAWAESEGVPVVYSAAGERNEIHSRPRTPQEEGFEGVFLIIVTRAPGNVWPRAFEPWRLCSSSATTSFVRSWPLPHAPSPHANPERPPSWISTTLRRTRKCRTSSPTSESRHEHQHPQLFHDVRPTSGLTA